MLLHTVLAFVLVVLTLVSGWSRADDLITVGSASTRVMTRPDSSGDVWYSIKVPVTSNSKSHVDVRLELQALDKDRFEIESMSLSASVPPGKTYILSDRTYMSGKDLRSVAKWALEDVSANETIASKVTLIGSKTKILKRPDSSGDIWFTVKADIRNDQDVPVRRINLQAIDSDGFELYEAMLDGNVRPKASGSLTDKTYMPFKDYKAIKLWRLVEK